MTSMRSDLQRIAHRAMLERGLVPEFSADEMAEAQAARSWDRTRRSHHPRSARAARGRRSTTTTRAISTSSPSPRRSPRTATQDPDRDRRRRRQGEAGVGARSPRADQHDVGLHRRADLPDAARAALHRPHLAQRRAGAPGPGGRHDRRRRRAGDGRGGSLAPWSSTGPSSPTTRSPPGSRESRSRPPRWPPSRGWPRTCGSRIASRRRSGERRHRARRAGAGDARAARGVRGRRRFGPPARAAKPRQAADRGLHGRRERHDRALPGEEGLPVGAAGAALARALGADRRAGGDPRHAAARRARRARAGGVPGRAPPGRSRALSRICRWRW